MQLPAWKGPWASAAANYATITIGTEANDTINVALAVKQGNRRTAVGSPVRLKLMLCSDAAGTTPASPLTNRAFAGTAGALIEGTDHLRDGLIAKATLIKDVTTAEQFSTSTTATGRIKGVTFTKAAAVDLTFTAAHVVTASKFGAILVQCTAAGTISTLVGEATQTTAMAYNTGPLAVAALPQPAAGNIALGYILIENNAGTWTANTDDLTDASDVTAATFVDATEQVGPVTFDAVTSAAGAFNFNLRHTSTGTRYLRIEYPDGSIQMSGAITFA
jgi:hypothetical protein